MNTQFPMSDYQDYLNVTKKKVCDGCNNEFPKDEKFYTFAGDKLCDECYADLQRELGVEGL